MGIQGIGYHRIASRHTVAGCPRFRPVSSDQAESLLHFNGISSGPCGFDFQDIFPLFRLFSRNAVDHMHTSSNEGEFVDTRDRDESDVPEWD